MYTKHTNKTNKQTNSLRSKVSSRVRRESWDENQKKGNDGGGGGAPALTLAQ